MTRRFLALLCLLPGFTALGAEPPTAMQAYEHVQSMRHQVDVLAVPGASRADLEQALKVTEQSLAFVHRTYIRELATGNIYLYAREPDLLIDKAKLLARMGEADQALSALEAAQLQGWYPIGEFLQAEDAFVGLREKPRFKHILAVTSIPDSLWSDSAIAVPYKPVLTAAERVAGLSLFWAEARANFVYFDHVPGLDWDKVYLEYLGKVLNAPSTKEYYEVMMQLAPLLRDSHTDIDPPAELQDYFFARPPIRTAKVGDKVLITAVHSEALARRVRVGEEIVTVDGTAVRRYAQARIAPYASSSTPQDTDVRLYNYGLLAGDAKQPVVLHLKDPSGSEHDESIERSGYSDVRYGDQFQFKKLPGNVAYFAIDHFENDAGVKALDAVLPEILKSRALILDLRENGGGSDRYVIQILKRLSAGRIAATKSLVRADDPYLRAHGSKAVSWRPIADDGGPGKAAAGSTIYNGPVAVLIGPQTFSAAEDFVVYFDSMKRGITVGETTGGSTGQPLVFKLPGGGSARICVLREMFPDGREFVGKGIPPSIAAPLTEEDVVNGTDSALERARLAVLAIHPT